MDHRVIARKLSKAAAELLLEHVDGTAFVDALIRSTDTPRVRLGLIAGRLLRYTQYGPRPRATTITEDGRAVLCFVLADYADALTAAGYAVAPARPSAITETARALASGGAFIQPPREVAKAKDLHEAV